MRIDMHVHTDRYSACSHMSPEAMVQASLSCGLDGIVITEHDVMWTETEVQVLRAKYPALMILRGIEVSTSDGHALVYGVSKTCTNAFYGDMPLEELTIAAHACGGIVVLAHPARYEDRIPDSAFVAGIDSVEAMSMNIRMYMAPFIQELQSATRLPVIAGSDAHATESLGFYATYFQNSIENEQDLVREIKERTHQTYCDYERIDAYNAELGLQVTLMQQLLRENGLASDDIRQKYGFTHAFQRGVRDSKDMRLRADCPVSW